MTALLLALVLAVPDTLTLQSCIEDAIAAFPPGREVALQERIADASTGALSTQRLPQIALQGHALYRSDLPEFPLAQPNATFPTISHDQYKLGLNVTQLIYDGGALGALMDVERALRALAAEQVGVEIHVLREQVEASYFGVLLARARENAVDALIDDLQRNLEMVAARVRLGVLPQATEDGLRVELLRLEQQKADVGLAGRIALARLSTLTQRALDDAAVLRLPDVGTVDISASNRRLRPEYDVFERSDRLLESRAVLTGRSLRPRLNSFAELAYGRPPGMNFFSDDLEMFYQVGIRVTWAPWDWHASEKERERLSLEKAILDTDREQFHRTISIAEAAIREEVVTLRSQLASDDEVVRLREGLSRQASSQLENGVITATEYVTERTAEQQARLAQQVHRLELAFAATRLRNVLGFPPP